MFDLNYSNADSEMFPLIDEQGNVIGQATRRYCHGGSMALHAVVHLHILNAAGELYLQKRSMRKDIQPGKWDTAVGGHIDFGEHVVEALKREAREELTLDISDFVVTDGAYPSAAGKTILPLFHYVWQSKVEREMVNAFAICHEGPFTPDGDEVDEARFWSMRELEEGLGKELFTPQFEQELPRLLNEIKKYKNL
ncbi:MAG: NUDIX domain-containing protein [Bacteroidales bacterium]|nr:NUDIX domain-containing protein [Candidatus Liminaster caballi]